MGIARFVSLGLLAIAGALSCGGRADSGAGGGLGSPSEPVLPPPTSVREPLSPPVSVEPPRALTCEENPLQSHCRQVLLPPVPNCEAGSTDPACPEEPPEPCDLYPALPSCPPFEDPYTVPRIETILAEYCIACHGPALTVQQARAGINFITDLDALVERGLIIECAAEPSPVVQMLRSNHGFDRRNVDVQPPAADIDFIVEWFDDGCDETRRLCAAQPALEGCSKVQAERVLDRRCGMCHGRAQRERQSVTGESAFSFLEIDDMVSMIRSGLVVPCDSPGSPLVQRMHDGSMPPAGSGQPGLRTNDEAWVVAFIDGLCKPSEAPEPLAERARLEAVLRASCGSCHGQSAIESGQVQGGVLPEDIVSLQLDRWLIPCNSGDSPLLQRMRSGDMPPQSANVPRPSPADIESLAAFVDRPCMKPAQ